jgi:NAD(P)-dependent dehydrogenase (short-subunit alcohol dehydrogenase family)
VYRGIGLALAKKLASYGFRVVLACRNPGRAAAATTAVSQHVPRVFDADAAHVISMTVDVASVESVKQFCQEFQRRYIRRPRCHLRWPAALLRR